MYNLRDIPLRHRLPMTRIKLIVARVLYQMLRLMRVSDKKRIRRGGINYEVDLTEGIDLFLYLFGVFQRHVVGNEYFSLPHGAIIFDVGANIGSMALNFAQRIPGGVVYAFEPTHFAFEKLKQNLSLNPGLAERVRAVQLFVSELSGPAHDMRAYSSWKVDGSARNSHPLHGGMVKSAGGISVATIDDFCHQNHIARVDLIKIDTDGYELEVLKGAYQTIGKWTPILIFEIGLYLLKEHHRGFEQYYNYLKTFDYLLINSKTGKLVTQDNYQRQIPLRSTTDIIAIPSNKMKLRRS